MEGTYIRVHTLIGIEIEGLASCANLGETGSAHMQKTMANRGADLYQAPMQLFSIHGRASGCATERKLQDHQHNFLSEQWLQ